MLIPFIPVIVATTAAAAGVVGVGSAINGASEMIDADEKMKSAEKRHNENNERAEAANVSASEEMDALGKLELEILQDFEDFSNTIEKIQNRPEFVEYKKDGTILPKYNKEELKKVSAGAAALLGGLGGAVLGTAGGYAAAGGITSAVMAFGTASTGTAISSLGGAPLINATLAALGGGAISVGGGGITLGSTVLGAATLGVGLLVGGIVFNVTGSKLSDKADEAWAQMIEAEKKVNKICNHLDELKGIAIKYFTSLKIVRYKYQGNFSYISYAVNKMHQTDWNRFSKQQKLATQNAVLLVGLLYKMCEVNLVNKEESEDGIHAINWAGISKAMQDSDHVLKEVA